MLSKEYNNILRISGKDYSSTLANARTVRLTQELIDVAYKLSKILYQLNKIIEFETLHANIFSTQIFNNEVSSAQKYEKSSISHSTHKDQSIEISNNVIDFKKFAQNRDASSDLYQNIFTMDKNMNNQPPASNALIFMLILAVAFVGFSNLPVPEQHNMSEKFKGMFHDMPQNLGNILEHLKNTEAHWLK